MIQNRRKRQSMNYGLEFVFNRTPETSVQSRGALSQMVNLQNTVKRLEACCCQGLGCQPYSAMGERQPNTLKFPYVHMFVWYVYMFL